MIGTGGFSLPAHATPRAARKLPRGRLRPSTMDAIWSKGRSNMSCSTNVTRSAGASVSRTTSSAAPTESARTRSSAGSPATSRTRLAESAASMASSRWAWRDRSMSRQMRATTVVNQPSRLVTASASERASRSQASWTVVRFGRRAEHAVGHPAQASPLGVEPRGQGAVGHIRPSSVRHGNEERTDWGCDRARTTRPPESQAPTWTRRLPTMQARMNNSVVRPAGALRAPPMWSATAEIHARSRAASFR
jgi:hypothetical protein